MIEGPAIGVYIEVEREGVMKFETYETAPGNYRWRLRDEKGEIVSVRPGKIMGLKASSKQKAVSERVVNEALKRLADNGARPALPRGPRRQSKRAAGA